MKIFKRLLGITRTTLLAILAVYAVAALILVAWSNPRSASVSPTATTEISRQGNSEKLARQERVRDKVEYPLTARAE